MMRIELTDQTKSIRFELNHGYKATRVALRGKLTHDEPLMKVLKELYEIDGAIIDNRIEYKLTKTAIRVYTRNKTKRGINERLWF